MPTGLAVAMCVILIVGFIAVVGTLVEVKRALDSAVNLLHQINNREGR